MKRRPRAVPGFGRGPDRLPWTCGQRAGLAAVYLGLVPSALGFVLWGYAVSKLPVAVSTSLLYLVPPVAVVLAWGWLGEVPLPAELLGGVVVIVGVVVISQGPRLGLRAFPRTERSPNSGPALRQDYGRP